ncbi:MAG: hypothetical protein ACHQU1_07705 [Gemmatimonadales bacterium]
MRSTLVAAAALFVGAANLAAQDTAATIRSGQAQQQAAADVRQLPREIAEEAIRLFNAPLTVRFEGSTRVPATRGVDGDVAVLGGPVHIAGHIGGSLTVINGDLVLEPGAVIAGDVLVVGGDVQGADHDKVRGSVRSYASVVGYRRVGDDLAYAPERAFITRWRRNLRESNTNFVLALDGTYNRVEGAPIVAGPSASFRLSPGARFNGDARLIMRTGENFSLYDGHFGYRARGEVSFGPPTRNLGLGLRLFDQVTSVEPWPLRDYEGGWAAFLLHDDYRDWYRRRGWGVYAALKPSRNLGLTLEAKDQDVFSKNANSPWALFHGSNGWRVNPAVSDGQYRSLSLGLKFDSRNDKTEPSSGFLVAAEVEATEGRHITGAVDPYYAGCGFTTITSTPSCAPPSYQDGMLTYQRAWFDARFYTRLTPAGRLNLRLAGGGKLGGDALPLQNRLSLGTPDPLPAYSFRNMSCGGDAYAGTPALCDRALLAQIELRTHLGFDFGSDWANVWGDNSDERYEPFHVSGPDIVVFADAGYAWNVGDGPIPFSSGSLPSLRLWQPDVGVGLDLGPIGAYFAKAIGPFHGPITFTVRMGRRF